MNESILTPPDPPDSVSENIAVRQTYTQKMIALFESRPKEWIDVKELAQVGGFAAWRSRIAEARPQLEKNGGTLEWNHHQRTSAYRFLPYVPVARDAGQPEPTGQQELFR